MEKHYQANKKLLSYSRNLRKTQTDAEKRLWKHIRNRQLGGFKFYRQFAVDKYILDFYCVEKRLGVELDGSQHITNEAYDNRRSNELKLRGIIILRFWDNEALTNTDGVLQVIHEHLLKTQNSP